MADLGQWLSGAYSVPAEEPPDEAAGEDDEPGQR